MVATLSALKKLHAMTKKMIAMTSSFKKAEVKTKVQMTEKAELSNQADAAEKEERNDQCQSTFLGNKHQQQCQHQISSKTDQEASAREPNHLK